MISIVMEMEASQEQQAPPEQQVQQAPPEQQAPPPELDPVSAGDTERIFTTAMSLNQQYAEEQAIRDQQEAEAQSAAARETEEAEVRDQVSKRKTSARISARVEEEVSKDPELPKLQAAQKVFSKHNADRTEQLATVADPSMDQKKNDGESKPVKESSEYI